MSHLTRMMNLPPQVDAVLNHPSSFVSSKTFALTSAIQVSLYYFSTLFSLLVPISLSVALPVAGEGTRIWRGVLALDGEPLLSPNHDCPRLLHGTTPLVPARLPLPLLVTAPTDRGRSGQEQGHRVPLPGHCRFAREGPADPSHRSLVSFCLRSAQCACRSSRCT
jgi:hypothetical protein